MSAMLTRTCYVSNKTRRDLELMARMTNPEATSELADALCESILRAHLDTIPALTEAHRKTAKFFAELEKETLRASA